MGEHVVREDNGDSDAVSASEMPVDRSDAVAEADVLIRVSPLDSQGYILKAEALASASRLEDALATLSLALERIGEDQKLLNHARNIAFRLGGIEVAADYALRLSKFLPGDAKNEVFVIESFLADQELAKAEERAGRLANASPSDPRGVMLKVRALMAQKKADQGLALLRASLDRFGDNQKFLSFAKNIAFEQRQMHEATLYASKLVDRNASDHKTSLFLVQCHVATGDFGSALTHVDRVVAALPAEPFPIVLKAQVLVALHRVAEALEMLRQALERHPGDLRLLSLARSLALQNGRFDQALAYAQELVREDGRERSKAYLVHSYMACGQSDEADNYLNSFSPTERGPLLRKEAVYYDKYCRLKSEFPDIVQAWQTALRNSVDRPVVQPTAERALDATMIQYWSQGMPPADVQILCNDWAQLLEREKLGRLQLFDRQSASRWIAENAPEFSGQFGKAFHVAMESDIFRIAYASKLPCIYMDIDSWSLEHSAQILRFALESKEAMLYLRAHRPWIANGFFVSSPEAPFFKKLVEHALSVDFDTMPKNYLVIESTFGPSRYNDVLVDLLTSAGRVSAQMTGEVPGCSSLQIDGSTIHLVHEAAVANVRPPFPLGYKSTDDYWKFVSLSDPPKVSEA